VSNPRTGTRDLTQGGVARTLISFAMPTLAVNILQTLNGTISAIYVGKMLGETAFAATSNANQLMFAVFALVFGFAMASSILIGQAVGRHDWLEVKRTTGAAFGLLLISGGVMAAAGWFLTPSILRALSVPPDVFPLAQEYVRIIFIGLPISLINMLLPALLRGIGDSSSPLWNTAINVILCIILNPVLIPVLGVTGAGLAGILANLICVIILIAQIYRRNAPIALHRGELHMLIPDRVHAKPLVFMGVPLGLSMLVMGVSQLIVIGLVNREGAATIAGFGAVNQLWSFLQMPAFAVATAVSAMAAQNIGAGRWDRVGRITWIGSLINAAMTAVVLIGMTLFETQLLSMFLPASSAAIPIGAHINLLVGWTFILMGIGSVVTSVIRANGVTMMPLWIQIISGILVRFAVAFPLYPVWGALAIWASFMAAAVSGTVLSIAYYVWGKWREKGREQAPSPSGTQTTAL
jgi:putative MATE family efflux protein